MYQYTHFIKQNIAPQGAKHIGVYDANGKRICTVPLGGLTPPKGEKLYSFGLVSDLHIYKKNVPWVTWNPIEKFDHALSYFESQGCKMCFVCGDLTQTGFYSKNNEEDINETPHLDLEQMENYKEICDKHSLSIYGLAGNHESYYNQPLTQNLEKWKTYTGNNLFNILVYGSQDCYFLLGQPDHSSVMSETILSSLQEKFEYYYNLNKNRRFFVFVHSYIEEDSGDPIDKRENSIFETWGSSNTNTFLNLLRKYNATLFHGHSHTKFECQELDERANYTEINGFKSVHIPSLGRPRTVSSDSDSTPYADNEAQGYLVDVYKDFIVLNGTDFIHNQPIPIGIYKIDTN